VLLQTANKLELFKTTLAAMTWGVISKGTKVLTSDGEETTIKFDCKYTESKTM
jgi:hypothetical protein